MPRLLAAPDKFRGTLSGAEAAAAMCAAAAEVGWDADPLPVSDGGEGLLDCYGGPNRISSVTGPLGTPVAAGWRMDGARAVIEMAAASGIAITAGHNDPMTASTRGTGELVRAAILAGAHEIVVGAGGSASTDGGLGAVEVLREHGPLDGSNGYRVVVATDVRTRFLDAAAVFGPQKGANAAQVDALTRRLTTVAARYRDEFGADVGELPGSGAAGGLAGGLAALGATIRPGFEVVAEQLQLPDAIGRADLVITGEGRVDATSLAGKATGSLAALAEQLGVAVVVVAGQVQGGLDPPFRTVDLVATFGTDQAHGETAQCIRIAVSRLLHTFGG